MAPGFGWKLASGHAASSTAGEGQPKANRFDSNEGLSCSCGRRYCRFKGMLLDKHFIQASLATVLGYRFKLAAVFCYCLKRHRRPSIRTPRRAVQTPYIYIDAVQTPYTVYAVLRRVLSL